MYDTFYSYEDYGFIDDEGNHAKDSRQIISLSYYALTTLSTIGYGDFLPKSVDEKLTMGLCLLFGVTIFSLIMNKLMDVLKDYKEIDLNLGQDPK